MSRPPVPRLMLVTDARRSRWPLLELAAEAVAGGVDGIYLRRGWRGGDGDAADGCAGDGSLGVGDAGDAGIAPTGGVVRELRARVGDEVALVVNGSAGRAQEHGAGLHLREVDPLPAGVRGDLGGEVLIGRSVHSPEAAAAAGGVDYLLAGHVYPSASKPGKAPLGLAGFAAIVAAAPCPVLAIGGITAERVAEVVSAGAHGVAVIGAIAEADEPRAAAVGLRAALTRALRSSEYQEASRMGDTTLDSEDTTRVGIMVNGKAVAVSAGDTVRDFLASKRMTDQMAIVERNGEIVPRGQYGATALNPGDRLEVVHAVGGG